MIRVILASAILLVPVCASAQRLAPVPRNPVGALPGLSDALRIAEVGHAPRALRRTYWLEGGVVGAIGLGLVTATIYRGLCESESCTGSTLGALVLGGGLGFTIGALVGGQVRKTTRDTSSVP